MFFPYWAPPCQVGKGMKAQPLFPCLLAECLEATASCPVWDEQGQLAAHPLLSEEACLCLFPASGKRQAHASKPVLRLGPPQACPSPRSRLPLALAFNWSSSLTSTHLRMYLRSSCCCMMLMYDSIVGLYTTEFKTAYPGVCQHLPPAACHR